MMKRVAWLGIGLAVTVLVVGAIGLNSATASGVQTFLGLSNGSGSSDAVSPVWNSGNLCTSIHYGPSKGDISCVSRISGAPYPLWYNFSAGGVKGATVNVTIYGSRDCINLNFKDTIGGVINIHLFGSDYSCPASSGHGKGWSSPASGGTGVSDWGRSGCSSGWGKGGPEITVAWRSGGGGKSCGTGVIIAANSEDETLNLVQCGRDYSLNLTVLSRSTFVNATQSRWSFHINDTVTYIGHGAYIKSSAAFDPCPFDVTAGKVTWGETSYGSHNTFSTIFVDGTNLAHIPPNYGYSTEPLGPPDGYSYGWGNLYGNETTTTAPSGACHYLVA